MQSFSLGNSLIPKKLCGHIKELLVFNKADMLGTLLNIINILAIKDVMGEGNVSSLLEALCEEIKKKLPGSYVFILGNGAQLFILHPKQPKIFVEKGFSQACFELRNNSGLRLHQIAIMYKCGTADIYLDKIEESFDNVLLAINHTCVPSYKNHLFADDVLDKLPCVKDHMQKAAYLQDAIMDKRFTLAFQPIVCAKNGSIYANESLLRIVTAEGDNISAGPFIEVAERMGFVHVIDELVLGLVIKELEKFPDIILSMNVSRDSVSNEYWFDKVKKLVNDPEIASRMILEITETGAQKDLDQIKYFTDFMQGLGCQIAIDDFGSGYTSFKQMQCIQADIVKIDGMFVKDIITDYDNRFFVEMLLNCAKTFHMKTIAEFVENGEVAKMLIEYGVDYMQGNYFGKAASNRSWVKQDHL